MKSFLGVLLGLLIGANTYALGPGDKAPELVLDAENNGLSLAKFAGKVVYLDFWASWCGPCKHSLPWMSEMQKKYGPKGLQIIGVNVDENKADAEAFIKANDIDILTAFDSKGANPPAYQVESMPSSFVIGKDGRVVAIHRGFGEAEKEAVEKEISSLLK